MIYLNSILSLKKDNETAEKFVRFAEQALPITEDVRLHLFTDDALLDRFSPADYSLQALLYQTALAGAYNLIIRRRSDVSLKEILAHEMAHLSQYVSGRLQMDVLSGRCWWEGKEYGNDVPYNERPWEQEAFKVQERLLKEFRKSKNKYKICQTR